MKYGDLISRQTVLELLQMKYFGKDLYRAIYELPSVENKGEWIPVSERLPENDGHYLVTWVDGNYQTVDIKGFANHLCEIDEIDFGNKTHSGWYEYDSENGHYEWDGVVAWQPLPEPYKAEKGGE